MVFLPVKHAVTPTIQSVFELHVFLHVEENERAEFSPLASSRGVAAELVRIVDSMAGRALQKAEIAYLLSFDPEYLERQQIWQKVRFAGLVDLHHRWSLGNP